MRFCKSSTCLILDMKKFCKMRGWVIVKFCIHVPGEMRELRALRVLLSVSRSYEWTGDLLIARKLVLVAGIIGSDFVVLLAGEWFTHFHWWSFKDSPSTLCFLPCFGSRYSSRLSRSPVGASWLPYWLAGEHHKGLLFLPHLCPEPGWARSPTCMSVCSTGMELLDFSCEPAFVKRLPIRSLL